MKVQVEVPSSAVDLSTKAELARLERSNKALKAKLNRKDSELFEARQACRRAKALIEAVRVAGDFNYDDYCD